MPPSFYLVHGPDEFASAEFVAGLKSKLGDPGLAELNTTLFDGRSVTLPEVRAVTEALPFLAPRRLVVVDGWLTRLLGKPAADADAARDDDGDARPSGGREALAALLDYLPHLPASTALVCVEKRELPARNPVLRAAQSSEWGYVKFFDLRKGAALVSWIRARAKTEGGEFSREAAEALAELETDPRSLGQEIVKLLTYVNFSRPVKLDDVQALTPAGGEANIFHLVDDMGLRRPNAALRELHHLLEAHEPLYVLSMIVRQYRLLLQVREQLEQGAGEAEISQALGLRPWVAGKLAAQARQSSLDDLERIYRRLLDYDVDIKTGQVEPATALDTLVSGLTAA